MRVLATSVVFVLLSFPSFAVAQTPEFSKWQSDIEKFEKDIQTFEALSKDVDQNTDWLLVTGSSSIRLWKTVTQDLSDYPILHRGYGGARYSDLAYFMTRILDDHQLQGVLIFVANDITGNQEKDKTPEETMVYVESILSDIKAHAAEIPVFFIAVTPTSKRWANWGTTQKLNTLLKEKCASQNNLHFIPTADLYQKADGTPNDELFQDDQLHLNSDGYALWAERINSIIGPVLKRNCK